MIDSDIYRDSATHHHGREHEGTRRDANPEDINSHASEPAPRDDEHQRHEEESRHEERITEMKKSKATILSSLALTFIFILTASTDAIASERTVQRAGADGLCADCARDTIDRFDIYDRIEEIESVDAIEAARFGSIRIAEDIIAGRVRDNLGVRIVDGRIVEDIERISAVELTERIIRDIA